jgi:hypothetical protein
MNHLSRQTPKVYKPSVTRCVICKRPIKGDSKRVAGLGLVGPDCYQEVAGFEKWIQTHKLEDLTNGGIVVTAQEIREKSVDHLLKARLELLNAGFHVFITPLDNGDRVIHLGKLHTRSNFRTFLAGLKNNGRDIW